MQYAEAVSVIRRIPLFAEMDPTTQKLLAFSSAYLVFHAGEVLFHQGDTTDSVYVIDEGMVDVIIVKSGKEIVLGQLGRHQLVGEMGIFRNALRSATIRAQGMVKALKIDADVFLRAVTGHPGAALAVMRALSDKLAIMSENYQKMSNLASPAAQK